MTRSFSSKWLVAFAVIALSALDSQAAERLPPGSHVGRCEKIGMATVATLEQAAKVIVCAVTNRHLLVVGEIHGSNESPDLVALLVKDAQAHRPVRLGLEMQRSGQPALDTYLRSAGSAADVGTFLDSPFWSVQDGRSSTALLRLIDSVRALRTAGNKVDVFAMEPDYGDQAAIASAGGMQKFKESGMTQSIQHAMGNGDSRQLVIALMGNFHSRYDGDHPYAPELGPSVVEQLAESRPYVVFPFARTTHAWNCQEDGCNVHSYTSTEVPKGTLPLFVSDVEKPKGPTMVKLWLPQMTAAFPAKGDGGKHKIDVAD